MTLFLVQTMTPFKTVLKYTKELDQMLVEGDISYDEWSDGYEDMKHMGWSEEALNAKTDSLW